MHKIHKDPPRVPAADCRDDGPTCGILVGVGVSSLFWILLYVLTHLQR